MHTRGTVICLASAVAFGGMAIFGKLAFDEGANVSTALTFRFVVAAALFWGLSAATGGLRCLRTVSRRDIATCLAIGAVAYAGQAGCYFSALERLDASLVSLLVYTFPAMVTIAAIALRREPASSRTALALVLTSAGLFLVMGGATSGALDPVGAAFAVTTAVIYATFVLTSAAVAERIGPLVLSALVCTGAATTLTIGGAAGGGIDFGAVSATGFVWLAGIACVSTVAAVGLFFAGLRRVGATTASILATAEPLTTVLLAFLAFGEALGGIQLAGAALVLGAVLVLSTPATINRKEVHA